VGAQVISDQSITHESVTWFYSHNTDNKAGLLIDNTVPSDARVVCVCLDNKEQLNVSRFGKKTKQAG